MQAKRMKQVRTKLDMTQAKLAAKLGINPQTVRNYEAGRSVVPPWMEYALVGILFEKKRDTT